MSNLTLIIPAKNEKESLPKVLDELDKFSFKRNIVLEASDKLTIEAIKNYDCEIIYQDSKGYGDALKKGIELEDVFQIVKKFKKKNPSKPLVLMGYFNLIYQSGESNFLNNCKKSGVDGLIIVDLPYPENKNFAKKCKKKVLFLFNFYPLLHQKTGCEKL